MLIIKPTHIIKVKEIKRTWWSNKITKEIEDFIGEIQNKCDTPFSFEISYASENIFRLSCFITFVFEGTFSEKIERFFIEI
jgi:hypothetical protein